jgi:3-oxoacyl-(acyl-carrier-protein) synthase
MMKGVYIKSTAVISPQQTFSSEGFPEFVAYSGVSQLKCIEPVYRDFIDPMASRRMSRLVKMGVCCALSALKKGGIGMPDAIVTGTGLGCLEDTEKFLGSVFSNGEKLLNPTPFIQSTHNTVAGAIALAIKCHHYNATYTHRGFSLESALQDAMFHVLDNPGANILAGGFDELTENSYAITRRMGLWKTHPVDTRKLLDDRSRGTLPGEGLAFFVLTGQKGIDCRARLLAMDTFYTPGNPQEAGKRISGFIHDAGLSPEEIDLALLGVNGDPAGDAIYDQAMVNSRVLSAQACFKPLCGEYDTASGFGLWLATEIIRQGEVPEIIRFKGRVPGKIGNILLYNHLRGKDHALYLLSPC